MKPRQSAETWLSGDLKRIATQLKRPGKYQMFSFDYNYITGKAQRRTVLLLVQQNSDVSVRWNAKDARQPRFHVWRVASTEPQHRIRLRLTAMVFCFQ